MSGIGENVTAGHVLRGNGTNFVDAQLGYGDLSGTPTLPSSAGPTSNQFFTAYNSGTGAFSLAQPSFSNLSGSIVIGQTPLTTLGDILYADVTPSLQRLAGNITTAKQYLSQTGTGSVSAAPVWATIAAADITGLAAIATSGKWSDLQNATAALTLANGTNATTFGQTSAVAWTWSNTTAATAGGVTSNSPIISLSGRLFYTGANSSSVWSLQTVLLPTSALNYTITNLVETAGNVVTATIGAHALVVGNWVTISGITGTFSYLNGVNNVVTAIAGTTITFTDTTAHGVQGTAASNGTVTQIPTTQLSISQSGSPGRASLLLPASGSASTPDTWPSIQFVGQAANVGIGGDSTASMRLFQASSSAASMLLFFTGGVGTMTQRGGISVGDNSPGNSIVALSTGNSTNFAACLQGGNTTNVTNPCVILTNANTLTAGSGTQVGVGIGGLGAGGGGSFTFAPKTNGSGGVGAAFQALRVIPVINQTSNTGTITSYSINASNVVTFVLNTMGTAFTNPDANDTIVISGISAPDDFLNGTWVINGAPTTTQLKVNLTHASVVSTPISGTAFQQATGSYTGILVNVTETALGGTANLLLDLQAGVSGGTSMLSVSNVGTITNAGGYRVKYASKSGNYTTTAADYALEFTATATLTLDSAVAVAGTTYRVKLTVAGTLTISPNNSKLIDGAASTTISTQYQSIDIVYNGAGWLIY